MNNIISGKYVHVSPVPYIRVSVADNSNLKPNPPQVLHQQQKQREQLPHLALHVTGKVGLVLDHSSDAVI